MEELKQKLTFTTIKIIEKINSLENSVDEKSKEEKEVAEALYYYLCLSLPTYESVLKWSNLGELMQDLKETWPKEGDNEGNKEGNPEEKKNAFSKTTDWIWDQREAVRDKWKWTLDKEWWKNLLRTAWFLATWAGAVALVYKWVKSLWNWAFSSKEEEEEETTEKKSKKKNWWKIWWAAALTWIAGFLWYKNWDKIKEFWKNTWDKVKDSYNKVKDKVKWLSEKEEELTIEESVNVAAWEVNCGKMEESIYRQNFEDWIQYDKENHNIISYWESTQIDEEKKCLVWLETVNFKSNIELVHAANIVNCLKRNLKWKWWAKQCFSETENWWDIAFFFSDQWANEIISGSNTDFWKDLLSVAWVALWGAAWYNSKSVKVWIWSALWFWAWWYILWNIIDNNSSLWKCCSTIKEWNNFSKFIAYLNSLGIWWEAV